MQLKRTTRRAGRLAVTAGLALALAGSSFPLAAFGDPQEELVAAQAKLEQIGNEYASLQAELDAQGEALQKTNEQIEQTSAKLEESQATLSDIMSRNYKDGDGLSLLNIILSSRSLSDLISSIHYAGKVSEAKAQAIAEVKDLQTQLNEQQEEQSRAMDETQEKLSKQGESQQEALALVNSLDAEVKAELEAEAARNAAVQAAVEAANAAQEQQEQTVETPAAPSTDSSQNSGSDSSDSNDSDNSGNSGTTPSQPSTPSNPGTSGGNSGGNSGSSSSGTSTVGASALSIALQYEGSPYVWGGTSPSVGFDCSGIVQYAYKQIGVSLPRTSGDQMNYVRSHGRWTTNINELQYGDLVFFPGHVAFYVGGGLCYGARTFGVPMGTASMAYMGAFLGGGQI